MARFLGYQALLAGYPKDGCRSRRLVLPRKGWMGDLQHSGGELDVAEAARNVVE